MFFGADWERINWLPRPAGFDVCGAGSSSLAGSLLGGHGKVTKNARGMVPIIHVVVNVAPGQMTANAARIKTVSCDKYVVQYSRFCPNPLALLQCIQLFTIVSTIVSDPNPT
jgi:hypothetical protein